MIDKRRSSSHARQWCGSLAIQSAGSDLAVNGGTPHASLEDGDDGLIGLRQRDKCSGSDTASKLVFFGLDGEGGGDDKEGGGWC